MMMAGWGQDDDGMMADLDCRSVLDRRQWNGALLSLPANHVLQSWEWGKVKSGHGWTPVRLLWERGGRPVAAAQVLRRPLPYTPWGAMYVPKGPALDYADRQLVERVLTDLEGHARRQRAIFIKVDPDTNLPQVVETLEVRGWRYSAEQIQFRNTALLDLTLSEDALLAAMKSKTRYNVRLAGRRGVTVRRGTPSDIPLFYEMYAETGQRDGFTIRPFAYYEDAWQTFLQAGLGQLLLAEVRGEAVAGAILFRFGSKAWYMYGASLDKHRHCMPNYALQWAAIRWAKLAGCTVYDMWGAPDVLDERDRLWGVWRFKEGLGAQFTTHIGAHDYATSPLLHWAYAVALPRYLGLLRRWHKKEVTNGLS
jgi:peptidoglycan pentaglycine glycine transferase (the first glycine)